MQIILLFVTINVVICSTVAVLQLPPGQSIPAVIVFGDSIVDAGNNNNLKTIAKSNFPPYGVDFQGHVPTGRFSDGKVPSDIFAEELGIKDLVPAYLDPSVQPQDLLTGVTFASGASGFDPLTPKLVSVLSLYDQLEYFREYKNKLKAIAGEEQANLIVAKALYVVVASSNDISTTYFGFGARKEHDIPSYTNFMVNSASDFIQELYNEGARRIGVLSAPPIGCVPSQRTLVGGIERNCAPNHNKAATLFNSKLSTKFKSLNKNLPDSRIVYIDIYIPLMDIIQYPEKYGFRISNRGCCGTGTVEASVFCNPLTPITCANISDHVFWDGYHPTERAYQTLVGPVLQKYLNQFF